MVFSIDHHIVIGVTLFGMVVDVLGGLFLAYDLLGGRKGPLRTLTRGITYLILCVSLSLCGVAVAFPVAIEFHFSILSKFSTSGTFGLLLGYMIAWGTGTAVGYLFTTPYAKTPKTERPKHRFKKAGKFGVWFLLWLIPWLVETLIFTSRNGKSLWRKVVPIIGYSVVAGFLLGFIIRKLFEPVYWP
jgi:hypothetical protein